MSRVGIISDTHDNLDKVRQAVALFNRLEVDHVVHCGDVVAQFVLGVFSGLKAPLDVVFGNCDGDRGALRDKARLNGFTIADGPVALELGGKRVVATHQPLAVLPACDYYLHGHTHHPLHTPGRPAVINPGEACGWLTGRSTAAVLDTDTGAVDFHDL
jgi:putative phosphoesterase